MSRAYTKEEVRTRLLGYFKELAQYWARQGDITDLAKCEGAIFSVLVALDGESMELPAFDVVLRPHPEDKDYHISEGKNWYEDGMIINENYSLHDEFCKKEM